MCYWNCTYWIIQIIKQDTKHLIDDGQHKVASSEGISRIHNFYHDSIGSYSVRFHIPTSKINGTEHSYLQQKYHSLETTKDLTQRIFVCNVTSHRWRGRPDFLIEMYDKTTNK